MSATPLPFVLKPEYRASFVHGAFQPTLVAGVKLYRLLGRGLAGGFSFILGQKPWFDEETFFDCVCTADGRNPAAALSSLRFLLRDRLAVSLDWNDFRSYAVLHIPRNTGLIGAVGRTEAKPYIEDGQGPGRSLAPLMLAGGATQYILDVKPGFGNVIVQSLAIGRA